MCQFGCNTFKRVKTPNSYPKGWSTPWGARWAHNREVYVKTVDTRCSLLEPWRMEEETRGGDETGLSIQTLLMRIQRLSTHDSSFHAPKKRNRTLPSQQPNHLTSLFHSFLSREEWSPQHPFCDHWWYKGTHSVSFQRFHHSIPIIEASLRPLFIPRFGSKYALIPKSLQSLST